MEALDEKDREGYINIVKSCLKEDFSYLLSGFRYDASLKQGPPRPLPPDTVSGLFRDVGAVTILAQEEEDDLGLVASRERWKLPKLEKFTYLITKFIDLSK